ncbi:glycosyltransferase family A protein [Algoriphagus halophilus]|uniref:glycosyltransferase family A protein n=1 Tax=Algoriphagus halophilus TaxID=226505 RepID=UPI00358F6C2C
MISQNQTGIHFQDENLEFISFDEKGLSKSRNRALENGKAELGLIADDDVAFCENFDAKIKKAFQEFPDADIITFKILTPTGENYKNYPESSFKHTRKSIYTVSSVEIVFKLERLKKLELSLMNDLAWGFLSKWGRNHFFKRRNE